MATHALYYDKRKVCMLDELEFNGPNIYARTDFSDLTNDDTEWSERINQYVAITRKSHELELDQQHKKGAQYLKDHERFLGEFGKHLWYTKKNDDGQVMKIRPPFFALDNYARIYLSLSVQYDRDLLARWFKNRMIFLQVALADFAVKMNADDMTAHLRALSQCSVLILHIDLENKDPGKIVAKWFYNLQELHSPIELFNDQSVRRQLDQACAEDGNKSVRAIL